MLCISSLSVLASIECPELYPIVYAPISAAFVSVADEHSWNLCLFISRS